MRRLRAELDAKDSMRALEAHLFRAARPMAVSDERKRRVRAALSRARSSPATLWLRLRPTVAALTLVVLACSVASAAIGRAVQRWSEARALQRAAQAEQAARAARQRSDGSLPGAELPATVSASGPPAVAAIAPSTVATIDPGDRSAAAPATAAPRTSPPQHRSRPPRAASASQPVDAAATAPARAAQDPTDPAGAVLRGLTSEEPDMLVDAVHALRRDHDAIRAALLLDYYLRKNPGGAASEEALALLVETAGVAHQDARVKELAERYLGRYPNGRYAPRVRAALAHR